MKQKRQIGIVMAHHVSFSAKATEGLMAYFLQNTQWTPLMIWPCEEDLWYLNKIKPDGIITSTWTMIQLKQMKAVKALGCPVVVVGALPHPATGVAVVSEDNHLAGRLAGQHFIDRGYVNIAFYGIHNYLPCDQKAAGLFEFLAEKSLPASMMHLGDIRDAFSSSPAQSNAPLERWLLDLPKPVGIFAHSDHTALRLLRICHQLGLHVPEEVAILGMDNIEPVCTTCIPQLSSIPLRGKPMGYQAGELLAKILEGKNPPDATVYVPPGEIVSRQSTDTFAVADERIRTALQFIRKHAESHIGVADIAAAANMSRRTLHRLFMQTLGRAPSDEIQRIRVERAQRFLRESSMSIEQIAARTGFSDKVTLHRNFLKRLNCTPGEYRKSFRPEQQTPARLSPL